MIIIENPEGFNDEQAILEAIGKKSYQFIEETTLDKCIYPRDHSINIGYYKDNVIICDDYQITSYSIESEKNLQLTKPEAGLCRLFPTSEILSVACHSVVNYHGYSLIKYSKKVRLKFIGADTPCFEIGTRLPEEEEIYANSYQREGANYWQYMFNNELEEFTEDQLMEDFTFGIAARRLGVRLDESAQEELHKTVFNKYKKQGFLQKTLSLFKI